MSFTIKVLVALTGWSAREGYIPWLQNDPNVECFISSNIGSEIIQEVASNTPDVLLVDLSVHDPSTSIVIAKSRQLHRYIEVILFSDLEDDESAKALRVGVTACAEKYSLSQEDFRQFITDTADGRVRSNNSLLDFLGSVPLMRHGEI